MADIPDLINTLKKTKFIRKKNENEEPVTIVEDHMKDGEKFYKCNLCQILMRPADPKGISDHLRGNKHHK